MKTVWLVWTAIAVVASWMVLDGPAEVFQCSRLGGCDYVGKEGLIGIWLTWAAGWYLVYDTNRRRASS